MSSKVVARYLDGRLVKGISLDVDPRRPVCHVRPADGAPVVVRLADLKALFFVRSLEGNSTHQEDLEPDPADTRARGAKLISLKFADGEEIVGMTIRFPPLGQFFFVVPVDTESNNVRILVNGDALVSLSSLPPSER